jgi:hypothetical protein
MKQPSRNNTTGTCMGVNSRGQGASGYKQEAVRRAVCMNHKSQKCHYQVRAAGKSAVRV